jgi:hypothetical protein
MGVDFSTRRGHTAAMRRPSVTRRVAPEIPVGSDRYGTRVKRGQVIGWAGKTGTPTRRTTTAMPTLRRQLRRPAPHLRDGAESPPEGGGGGQPVASELALRPAAAAPWLILGRRETRRRHSRPEK